MKNKSIFSYDKEPNCAYCVHNAGDEKRVHCALGGPAFPCESFRYDVFKRKPRQTPKLENFDSEDFSL